MSKNLVVITGQLRNCSDNIQNWIKTAFDLNNTHFLFYIWDEIGKVDRDKVHLKCLNHKNDKSQLSKSNTYFFKEKSTLEDEINKIKKILGENVEFVIEPYKNSYMEKAGELEITDIIKKENSPWWQGMIPVFYINHLANKYINKKYNNYEFYYRVQSECQFNTNEDYSFLFHESIKSNTLITSPQTINNKTQVSIKFFGGRKDSFELMMNAYEHVIPHFKKYKKGQPSNERPIGERFLKQLSKKNNLTVKYLCNLNLNRERLLIIDPVWVEKEELSHRWNLSKVTNLESSSFLMIKNKIEAIDNTVKELKELSLNLLNNEDYYNAQKTIQLAIDLSPNLYSLKKIRKKILTQKSNIDS